VAQPLGHQWCTEPWRMDMLVLARRAAAADGVTDVSWVLGADTDVPGLVRCSAAVDGRSDHRHRAALDASARTVPHPAQVTRQHRRAERALQDCPGGSPPTGRGESRVGSGNQASCCEVPMPLS
jgi:hypothetical protein